MIRLLKIHPTPNNFQWTRAKLIKFCRTKYLKYIMLFTTTKIHFCIKFRQFHDTPIETVFDSFGTFFQWGTRHMGPKEIEVLFYKTNILLLYNQTWWVNTWSAIWARDQGSNPICSTFHFHIPHTDRLYQKLKKLDDWTPILHHNTILCWYDFKDMKTLVDGKFVCVTLHIHHKDASVVTDNNHVIISKQANDWSKC